MPVTCYQVAECEQVESRPVLAVSTYSLAAPQTNLGDLLWVVAPSMVALGASGSLFDPSYRYQCAVTELPAAMALLNSHTAPVVTAVTQCSVSACLDFYQHPDEAGNWIKTETGALVFSAKYRSRLKQAGPVLAARVTDFVSKHPIMSKAVGVVAIPSSQTLGPADEKGLVAGLARWVSRELRMPIVHLERVKTTAHAQKNLPEGEDADANQANTMSAVLGDQGIVLVLDDLMRDASTMHEANRALRSAGATGVASLTLVKERTGTRQFHWP